MFAPFQTRSKVNRHSWPGAFVVAAVCLALVAVLAVAQVTHTHPANNDADRCPLCIVMHSASPVVSAAALITLVQVAMASPAAKVRAISRHWHAQLFTRPPPYGC